MKGKRRVYCAFSYLCNNNCLACAVDAKAHCSDNISTKDAVLFIDSLSARNDEIELSGGEPTARKDFLYLAEHISSRGMQYMLLTNGRSFSNPYLAAKLSDAAPESIAVPIHAPDAGTHDLLSGAQGSFRETLQGMKNILDYGMNLVPKTVVNKINAPLLPEIIGLFACELDGCKTVCLNGLDFTGSALRNKDIVGVKFSEAAPHIERAIDAGMSAGLEVKLYTMPVCAFKKEYHKNVGVKPLVSTRAKTPIIDEEVSLKYGFVDACKHCTKRSQCTGVWYSYYQVYGTGEIHPV